MIRFFRKIRFKLMSENKTGKYFKYAIGEIILVMVGILLALQVNNWNENRKKRLEEITILENIKQDLTLDEADINYNMDNHFLFLKEEKKLLAYLQNDSILLDKINLNDALGVPLVLALHESTFMNLQNNEIGILSNNKLRKSISRLYDFYAKAVKKLEDKNSIAYDSYSKKLPYFLKYCRLSKNEKQILEETNYEDYVNISIEKNSLFLSNIAGAKNDEAFKIILSECALFRDVTLGFYSEMKKRMKEIQKEIDVELEALKN